MDEQPIRYFGTPAKSDFTVMSIRVNENQYAFRILRTAPTRQDGITIQEEVVARSATVFDDRDAAISDGIREVHALFDPSRPRNRESDTFSPYTLLAEMSQSKKVGRSK